MTGGFSGFEPQVLTLEFPDRAHAPEEGEGYQMLSLW